MVLIVLSIGIIMAFFIAASRNMKIVPSKFQYIAESVYDFGRNNIAREQIGSKDFMPYVPLIVSLFAFVLVNNIFGIIPTGPVPDACRTSVSRWRCRCIVIYPLYHFVGFRRHGFTGYLRHALMPPGVPTPIYFLLVPIEIFTKFFMNPITHGLRVFAAMFAGHLILLLFTLGGEFMLLHGGGLADRRVGLRLRCSPSP